ncbi:hypothetical protein AAE02nite_50090 [Adhaeribacter aerolatus]|uniref:Uncharacterized protein n=1 Tax=Adhaeribacter aerolatus TaxID=670289 RepID=A0A512B5V2_9BACT|nr:hypothetical protein [Adhaeribacter aerolatus]GEO07345.1 hypothetical protein AAE02nite_50090 [Adhaeribacter aerolatus]
MHFRVLGSSIEYQQAAKRLEQLANAQPNTPEALELKELMAAFIRYEKEIKQTGQRPENKNKK